MKQWYIKPNVVLREESDDWGMLFDADTGHAVALNPVAVCMFKAMQKARDVESVTAVISAEYDEVPETVDQDIHELIQKLTEAGFLGFAND
jgi:hypothetical protein